MLLIKVVPNNPWDLLARSEMARDLKQSLYVYVRQAISLTRLIRICTHFSNGYFVYTALEVRKMKMYDFKTRGGGEICLSDVKMH